MSMFQPADYFELKATIDPTRPCEDFGYSYYMDTLAFVNSKLQRIIE